MLADRSQSRDTDGSQRRGPLGMLVRGVATGIGLASESIQHHREKKLAEKAQEAKQPRSSPDNRIPSPNERFHEPSTTYDPKLSQQLDEATWDLDDAQRSAAGDEPPPYSAHDSALPADSFICSHPPPASPLRRLSMPVIITQRRPKSRSRGFVRAYAPLLQDVGIDQPTFLTFLDQLNKAVEPSPWVQAINIAAFATGLVPEVSMMAVSAALLVAGRVAGEASSRSGTNKFLDRMNHEFFAPRGLVALLLTWRPEDADSPLTDVDFNMNRTIARAGGEGGSGMSRARHRLQSSSAESAFDWPESAPLIFPDLDALVESEEGAEKKKSALNRGGQFVQLYMDRRAQAKWAGANPDSRVANAAPKPQFRSRYADPNHPAASGELLALLTGGYLHSSRIMAERERLTEVVRGVSGGGARGSDIDYAKGRIGGAARSTIVSRQRFENRRAEGGPEGINSLQPVSGITKFLSQDVLYLMIVDMPSQEEMAQAQAMLTERRRR